MGTAGRILRDGLVNVDWASKEPASHQLLVASSRASVATTCSARRHRRAIYVWNLNDQFGPPARRHQRASRLLPFACREEASLAIAQFHDQPFTRICATLGKEVLQLRWRELTDMDSHEYSPAPAGCNPVANNGTAADCKGCEMPTKIYRVELTPTRGKSAGRGVGLVGRNAMHQFYHRFRSGNQH